MANEVVIYCKEFLIFVSCKRSSICQLFEAHFFCIIIWGAWWFVVSLLYQQQLCFHLRDLWFFVFCQIFVLVNDIFGIFVFMTASLNNFYHEFSNCCWNSETTKMILSSLRAWLKGMLCLKIYYVFYVFRFWM